MKAYIFPGQSSQFLGMGGELFDKYSAFIKEADDILGYSIKELCLEDPKKILDITLFTQPALYVVNSLHFFEKALVDSPPDFVAGYSLGEHCALLAAGVYDFATGLRVVQKRASLMSKATGGRMVTVSGFSEVKVSHIIEQYSIDNLYIAGINSPSQIVIAGTVEAINTAKSVFLEEGVRSFTIHDGNGAYHTPLMEETRKEFLDYISDLPFQKPKIPVVSNVLGAPYAYHRLKERMASQMTHTIRWPNVVTYLLQNGANEIIQIGSSRLLSGWTNQTRRLIHLSRSMNYIHQK